MSCQLEERLKNLEDKVSTTHELLIELRTIWNSPYPVREELSAMKAQMHTMEIVMTRQEGSAEKVESIAKDVFEKAFSGVMTKVIVVCTILSLLVNYVAREIQYRNSNPTNIESEHTGNQR